MVTIVDIRHAVRHLKLSGKPVCLHSSLRSFGCLEGGAASLVDGFLGEGCTLLVPTFSDDFSIPPPPDIRPPRNGWAYGTHYAHTKDVGRVYEPGSNEVTVEEMGVVPVEVLARPSRFRGSHPLCSFAAVGEDAERLIAPQTVMNVFAPLYELCRAGGSIVLIGVGLYKMTLLHAAEQQAGRNPFIRWANDANGQPTGVTMGGCSDGFEKLASALSPLANEARVGESLWHIYPAERTLRAAAMEIAKRPEITRCANPNCERCRDAIDGGPIWSKTSANN